MFDIGFQELLLLSVIALLVIGPERLPGTIRTASLWLGRLRRSFQQIKMEVEREINADEIRQQLHNESVMSSLEQTQQQVNEKVADMSRQLRHDIEQLEPNSNDSSTEAPTTTRQHAAPADTSNDK